MNICIVTVYNSVNSGSFWQAYALKLYIEKLGHKVYFLRRKLAWSSSSKIYQAEVILWNLIRGRMHSASYICSMYKAFDKTRNNFTIMDLNQMDEKHIDLVILGSDTIWNLDSKYFAKNRKKYWGGCFGHIRVVTYAASLANTSIDTIRRYPELVQYADRMDKISVRDQYTKEIISVLTGCTSELVCDPTFLFDREDYALMADGHIGCEYIFLYLFEELGKELQLKLMAFAKEKGFRIISGESYRKYCDVCVINSPKTFLMYMLNAKYVVTDTFHGTVFSVNLEKQFVVIERNKKKVNDFLFEMEFEDRKMSDDSIVEILNKKIDYSKRNEKVQAFKNRSREYLKKIIKEGSL